MLCMKHIDIHHYLVWKKIVEGFVKLVYYNTKKIWL
jgi:hypothetical protein